MMIDRDIMRILRKPLFNLFSDFPELEKAWDWEHNELTPSQIDKGRTQVAWRCENGHIFYRTVYKYIAAVNKCPDCARFAATAAAKPQVMKFWDYERNSINPKDVLFRSNTVVYFRCPDCGYKWSSQVRCRDDDRCPYCSNPNGGVIYPGRNDVATLYPELLQDFATDLNPGVDLSLLGPSSSGKLMWRCHICGYEWSAPLYSRIRKDGDTSQSRITSCQACLGNIRIKPYSEDHPELLSYYSENNDLPLDKRFDGNEKVFWRCEKHGDFQAVIKSMIRSINIGTNGCPYCHGTKIRPEDSLGAINPEWLSEWDPDNELSPYEVSLHSSRDIKWICPRGHHWTAAPDSRANGHGYCRKCYPAGKQFDSFIEQHPEAKQYFSASNDRPLESYCATSNDKVIWVCEKGHEHIEPIRNYHVRGHFYCPTCAMRNIIPGENDLQTQFPDIAVDYDESRNALSVDQISPINSDMSIWWHCKEGHSFQRSPQRHISCKGLCPVCGNYQLSPGVNDLQTLMPEIAALWDYENNTSTPDHVLLSEKRSYNFTCALGHRFNATLQYMMDTGCQCLVCAGLKLDANANSFAAVNPVLAAEWSLRNTRGPETVMESYRAPVWWECPTCHDTYQRRISDRTVGDESCPTCRGLRRTVGVNDLATTHPELVKEWDASNDITPDSVRKTSRVYVQWKCPRCHGVYPAMVCDRDVGDDKCPYCAGTALLPGFNDFETRNPVISAEWSADNEYSPNQLRFNSRVLIAWTCSDCGGQYTAYPSDRHDGDAYCPFCSGKRLLTGCNDLATTNPALASEWSSRNDRSPETVMHSYSARVWWVCPHCHGEYVANVNERQVDDDSCPYCSGESLLTGVNDLTITDPELASEWSVNNDRGPETVMKSYFYNAWWTCSQCGQDYRCLVRGRHLGDSHCLVCAGLRVGTGVNDLQTMNPELAKEWSSRNPKPASQTKFDYTGHGWWTCPKCGLDYQYPVCNRSVEDESCSYCYGRLVQAGVNDLASRKPEVAAEWSSQNEKTASEVRYNAKVSAFWECAVCHGTYTAVIYDREAGDDACPYCSNRKVLFGLNDLLTVNPSLTDEWSPNNSLSANAVRFDLSMFALWICPTCGGEYQARVRDRQVGDDSCPYCTNRKALPGFNSLACEHPELLGEWYSEANLLMGIDPDHVLSSGSQLAWWMCPICQYKYPMNIAERVYRQKRKKNPCPRCNGRRTLMPTIFSL